jgi:hypothetical protein
VARASFAKTLAPIEVLDPEGNAVRLGGVWSRRPVVLVFIRHFG